MTDINWWSTAQYIYNYWGIDCTIASDPSYAGLEIAGRVKSKFVCNFRKNRAGSALGQITAHMLFTRYQARYRYDEVDVDLCP